MKVRNVFGRQIFSLLMIAFLALVVWSFFDTDRNRPDQETTITQIAQEVKNGRVERIIIQGNKVTAITKDNLRLTSFKEPSQGLKDYGIDLQAVPVEINNPDSGAGWTTALSVILPFVLFGLFLYFISRQARSGNMQAMSFGKSTARPFEGKKRTTFADVAGLKTAKQELMEVVEFLKQPAKFTALGAEIPKGVLLLGPAGVGKTLLAKAVAGEAEVPFFSISASEFVEMFVGVGASRVRDLFNKAKRMAPTVIFIDELDAVGRQRGAGLGGSHDEREQTLNQILVEMDGFETETNVIVLAATNRPDVLDPALLRPGRFDRKVVLDPPDREEREEILKVHVRQKPVDPSVKLTEIAQATPGLSGADLRNVTNEAAILAARSGRKKITQPDFRQAIEKVILGPLRSNHLLQKREREIVAYHEAGHAIIGHILPDCDPIHKVSIIARGLALGYTLSLPAEEKKLIPRTKFLAEIVQLLGGRAAEEIIFKDITTGSANDLERSTALARNMVTIFGMSRLGPIKFADRDELVFLGREMGLHRVPSESLAAKIDAEIASIIDECWQRALKLLKSQPETLALLANGLLEKETLEDAELAKIWKNLKTKTS
ncbi:MAG: ATP-dependent zinc metalloprotease FtsH [Patescibacteria group bacterium]